MRSRAAIVRTVGGAWSVEEFELDAPRAGEVLVQMAAAGFCHSDDHIRNGFMTAPAEAAPTVPAADDRRPRGLRPSFSRSATGDAGWLPAITW